MKKLRLILAALAASAGLMLLPVPTLAVDCNQTGLTTQQALQCGTNSAGGNNQDASQATKSVNDTIATVLNLLSVAVGIIAVIMIIMGGLRYILSSGSQEKVTSAKNTLLYAVIGLIIVALAQIIVQFVLNKATATPSSGSLGSSSSACSNSQAVC